MYQEKFLGSKLLETSSAFLLPSTRRRPLRKHSGQSDGRPDGQVSSKSKSKKLWELASCSEEGTTHEIALLGDQNQLYGACGWFRFSVTGASLMVSCQLWCWWWCQMNSPWRQDEDEECAWLSRGKTLLGAKLSIIILVGDMWWPAETSSVGGI